MGGMVIVFKDPSGDSNFFSRNTSIGSSRNGFESCSRDSFIIAKGFFFQAFVEEPGISSTVTSEFSSEIPRKCNGCFHFRKFFHKIFLGLYHGFNYWFLKKFLHGFFQECPLWISPGMLTRFFFRNVSRDLFMEFLRNSFKTSDSQGFRQEYPKYID